MVMSLMGSRGEVIAERLLVFDLLGSGEMWWVKAEEKAGGSGV